MTGQVLGAGAALLVGMGPAAAAPPLSSPDTGDEHTCFVTAGRAYCWGDNTVGQLGNGTTSTTPIRHPVPVKSIGALAGKVLTQVTTGSAHACTVDVAGRVYCWGDNTFGQLGNTAPLPGEPTQVTGLLSGVKVVWIAAGANHTCAVAAKGLAYCWGANTSGQLGNGGNSGSHTPVAVTSSVGFTEITAGSDYTCALTPAGAAYCWGANGFGQLGSTTSTPMVPSPADTSGVLGGKILKSISAGGAHTCAVSVAGRAFCWGLDSSGQLGDGISSTPPAPVEVATPASTVLVGLSAGTDHTCAVDTAGAAHCWGNNSFGKLGNPAVTTGSSNVPVPVDTSATPAVFKRITAGRHQTCAVDGPGQMFCWGSNVFGQLGNQSIATSTPVPVTVTQPDPPTHVTLAARDRALAVSWQAPANLAGGTLFEYTATAWPAGARCVTTGATSCTINGLANGTEYVVLVVAHTTAGPSSSAGATGSPGADTLAITGQKTAWYALAGLALVLLGAAAAVAGRRRRVHWSV